MQTPCASAMRLPIDCPSSRCWLTLMKRHSPYSYSHVFNLICVISFCGCVIIFFKFFPRCFFSRFFILTFFSLLRWVKNQQLIRPICWPFRTAGNRQNSRQRTIHMVCCRKARSPHCSRNIERNTSRNVGPWWKWNWKNMYVWNFLMVHQRVSAFTAINLMTCIFIGNPDRAMVCSSSLSIDWLIDWLIDWSIDWLIVWLIDWLIDCFFLRTSRRSWT